MVKIPSLDELKKMGSELVDSAKSSKLASMVTAGKKETVVTQGNEGVQKLFQNLTVTLRELNELQTKQVNLVRLLENQTAELMKTVEASQQATGKTEDKFE